MCAAVGAAQRRAVPLGVVAAAAVPAASADSRVVHRQREPLREPHALGARTAHGGRLELPQVLPAPGACWELRAEHKRSLIC